jgi:hypothetical protein
MLGGFILDVVIAYFVKLLLRLRRAWGSSKWKLTKARVDSSCVGGGRVWNCPTAEVAYTYEFDGQTYSGIDSTPFLSSTSAKERADRFKPEKLALVRVNSLQPQRSLLKLTDQ